MEASVSGTETAEKAVVAVRAEKVISKTALAWALTHVVRPGDCIALLAVFPDKKRDELPERIGQISETCSQMVLQFHNQIEVRVRIKVLSAATKGAVAAEAKRNGASWVILDKTALIGLRRVVLLYLKSDPNATILLNPLQTKSLNHQ